MSEKIYVFSVSIDQLTVELNSRYVTPDTNPYPFQDTDTDTCSTSVS